MASISPTLISTSAMPWESGLDYLRTLAPAFRDNLGPAEQVQANFAKYRQKNLYLNPETTRRLDLVELEAGYSDLTHCCHDSVEEGLVLGGEVVLDGEGTLQAGDYFWRPPGWIHHAKTGPGVRLLLGFEGRSNESGPVTRQVCAVERAGRNHLHDDDEAALGTRGRLCRVRSTELAWQPGQAYARGEGDLQGFDLAHLAVRVLSRNARTGQQTLLLRLAPGYRQHCAGSHAVWWQMFVLAGSVQCGPQTWDAGAFVHQGAGCVLPALASPQGALIYAKVDGWLDFSPEGAS